MSAATSLDPRDRRLLLSVVGVALGLAVIVGVLMPNPNAGDNPLPSSYLAGQHGARAAYDTLLRSGYAIERWERPLSELASTAGPETVVILAQPFSRETADIRAVRQIVERGGRVLATGFWGGFLLPEGQPTVPSEFTFAACQLEPEGLDPLANSGEVWMVPEATWQVGNPMQRTQYTCAGQPAVVEYDEGKGHVVWWASATPLENGSLARAEDLKLLLNSLGPRAGHRFYWDESLHGDVRSMWSYAAGPALNLLRIGLVTVGLLVVFSFSRRSGPLRAPATVERAAPVEFIEALGTLYRNAGAQSTAVAAALEEFRRWSLQQCGLRTGPTRAEELAAVIHKRFPHADAGLETDLVACEEAVWDEAATPAAALKLVQALHRHRSILAKAAKAGTRSAAIRENDSNREERAS